jgi:hypothetical protein
MHSQCRIPLNTAIPRFKGKFAKAIKTMLAIPADQHRHYVVCIQLLAHASDVKKSLIYIAKQAGSQMFKFASSNATRQNLNAWLRLQALYDEGKGGKYGNSTTVKRLSEIWLRLYEK